MHAFPLSKPDDAGAHPQVEALAELDAREFADLGVDKLGWQKKLLRRAREELKTRCQALDAGSHVSSTPPARAHSYAGEPAPGGSASCSAAAKPILKKSGRERRGVEEEHRQAGAESEDKLLDLVPG